MDSPDPKNTTWWITSLAISVVCCAILFVVFAGYFDEVKESLAVNKIRFDMAEQQLHALAADVETLRRHTVQQIQLVPSANGGGILMIAPSSAPLGSVPVPSETKPELKPETKSEAPAAPVTPDTAAQPPTTAPTTTNTTLPAPASPTAVPEVPAKH